MKMNKIKMLAMVTASLLAGASQAQFMPFQGLDLPKIDFSWSNKATEAEKRGDWSSAIDYKKKDMANNYDYNSRNCSVVNASGHLELFLLYWNVGQKSEAKAQLRKCVEIIQNDSTMKPGCADRAAALLKKVENDELSGKFTYADMSQACGIACFVMEVPYAVYNANMDTICRRYQAMAGMFEAKTQVYRKQGEMVAFQAKTYAKGEYEKKHHRTFDPDDRPSEESGRREDWDACKRVYDIFK